MTDTIRIAGQHDEQPSDDLIEYVGNTFLKAQVKAPTTYQATAVEHPWLTPYYEDRGYVPFHPSTKSPGTPLVSLRNFLNPEVCRDTPAAEITPSGVNATTAT